MALTILAKDVLRRISSSSDPVVANRENQEYFRINKIVGSDVYYNKIYAYDLKKIDVNQIGTLANFQNDTLYLKSTSAFLFLTMYKDATTLEMKQSWDWGYPDDVVAALGHNNYEFCPLAGNAGASVVMINNTTFATEIKTGTGASSSTIGKRILQVKSVRVAVDATPTSSTSFVDMTNMSVPITTQTGSELLILSSFATSTSALLGATTSVIVDFDASTESGAGQTFPGLSNPSQGTGFSLHKISLSAGSHTFKLRWKTSDALSAARCRPATNPNTEHASLIIMEIK